MTDTSKGFTIVRNFDASAEAIWQAWTDADEIAEWWHPRGMHTPRETVYADVRVGGRYHYTMVLDTTGDEYPTGGRYIEVDPQQKLVFTWGHPEVDDSPVVTVTVTAGEELSRVTFDLRGEEGTKGDESFYDGWDSALDSLAEHLGQTEILG